MDLIRFNRIIYFKYINISIVQEAFVLFCFFLQRNGSKFELNWNRLKKNIQLPGYIWNFYFYIPTKFQVTTTFCFELRRHPCLANQTSCMIGFEVCGMGCKMKHFVEFEPYYFVQISPAMVQKLINSY